MWLNGHTNMFILIWPKVAPAKRAAAADTHRSFDLHSHTCQKVTWNVKVFQRMKRRREIRVRVNKRREQAKFKNAKFEPGKTERCSIRTARLLSMWGELLWELLHMQSHASPVQSWWCRLVLISAGRNTKKPLSAGSLRMKQLQAHCSRTALGRISFRKNRNLNRWIWIQESEWQK